MSHYPQYSFFVCLLIPRDIKCTSTNNAMLSGLTCFCFYFPFGILYHYTVEKEFQLLCILNDSDFGK